jgi:hypothetical protein
MAVRQKNPEASATTASGTFDASGKARQNLAQILLSGGNSTPMELFLAGLKAWDNEIRRKLMVQAIARH